jgi:hypothetical protein
MFPKMSAPRRPWIMAKKQYTTEEITHKLRETDVLIGQGKW